MAKEEVQEISPEEKLLKVIQKGDAEKKAGRPAPPGAQGAGAAKAAAETGASSPSEKTKPKLARPEPASAPAAKAGVARPGAPSSGKPAAATSAQPFRKPARGKRNRASGGAQAVNLALVAVAVIMVMLTGVQIRANVLSFRADRQVGAGPGVGAELSTATAAALPDTGPFLSALDARPLFPVSEEGQQRPPPVSTSWQGYVKENLAMIGVSKKSGTDDVFEAILVDRKVGKMHFVTSGQKIALAQQDLKVEKISGEETVLTDGSEKASVKPRSPASLAQPTR